jgi:hypothetical protein
MSNTWDRSCSRVNKVFQFSIYDPPQALRLEEFTNGEEPLIVVGSVENNTFVLSRGGVGNGELVVGRRHCYLIKSIRSSSQ